MSLGFLQKKCLQFFLFQQNIILENITKEARYNFFQTMYTITELLNTMLQCMPYCRVPLLIQILTKIILIWYL